MFDIGFSELLLFGIIALIVLGPEKLPKAARTAGQWYAKIRRTVSTLQSEIETELDLVETRQQMQQELAKIRQTEAEMRREMAEMRGSIKEFEYARSRSTQNQGIPSQDTKKSQGLSSKSTVDPSFDEDSADGKTYVTKQSEPVVHQPILTRPWENMWFRLGAYDKARRLPSAPFLPNYKADTLLNAAVNTQGAAE